jgi:hypothetical protein
MTDLELLSSRVVKLEKRLRWMTRAALAGCFIIGAGAILAQAPKGQPQIPLTLDQFENGQKGMTTQRQAPPESEVRSQHFTLVDSNGKDRASLVADNAGTVFLVMFDAARKTRANLSVGNEGPSLVFYDASGRARTIIGSTTVVGSHVNENGIAELSPPSSIVLFDKAGKLLWREP